MVRTCCVRTCKELWMPNSSISFFAFPYNNKELKEKWFQAGPGYKTVSKNSYICSNHFLPEDYSDWTKYGGKRILKKNAVPHIFDCTRLTNTNKKIPDSDDSNHGENDSSSEANDANEPEATDLQIPSNTHEADKHGSAKRLTELQYEQNPEKKFCSVAVQTCPRLSGPSDREKYLQAKFDLLQERLRRRDKRLNKVKDLVNHMKNADYNKVLTIETILRRWDDLCLDRRDINLIMIIGKFRRRCQVKKFLAIAVGLLSSSLFETMLMICELFTLEPDGGSAMIPVSLFMEIYGYLAGLRCDGGKRDSSEEDPSEFLIFDKADSGPRPPEIHPTGSGSTDVTTGEQASLASQDTGADVDDDLESSSKEPNSGKPENRSDSLSRTGSTPNKGKNTPRKNLEKSDQSYHDTAESMKSMSEELNSEGSESKTEYSKKIKEPGGEESSNENTLTSDIREKQAKNDEKINSDKARKKLQMEDKDLMIYYPNVPGIGPRLLPEEIAAVAMWMTECAKLQEGMVGPRNLRHFQCPPLDRRS